MDANQILALYDQQMRRDPPPEGATVTQLPGLTRCMSSSPGAQGGWILYTQLDDQDVEQVIQEQIAAYAAAARGFEWKTYDHDRPPDLRARLLAHGFTPEEPEALLVLDLANAPARLLQPPTADIRRLAAGDTLADLALVSNAVWPGKFAEMAPRLAAELEETPPRMSLYIAYVAGQPASAARIEFHPARQFAELYGGSTVPAQRGRGLYTALIAVRAQEALARGVRFLTVDASPMSRPILERLGFQFLTMTQPYVWQGAA